MTMNFKLYFYYYGDDDSLQGNEKYMFLCFLYKSISILLSRGFDFSGDI